MTPLDILKVWGHFRPCGEDRSRCVEGDRWIFPGLFAATTTRYFSRSGRAICSCVFGDRTMRIKRYTSGLFHPCLWRSNPDIYRGSRAIPGCVCGDKTGCFDGDFGIFPAMFVATETIFFKGSRATSSCVCSKPKKGIWYKPNHDVWALCLNLIRAWAKQMQSCNIKKPTAWKLFHCLQSITWWEVFERSFSEKDLAVMDLRVLPAKRAILGLNYYIEDQPGLLWKKLAYLSEWKLLKFVWGSFKEFFETECWWWSIKSGWRRGSWDVSTL